MHTNKLIEETSPYLLQHAHNPVDWYPWGPEAMEKAEKENKLLLISIGYSACHWCHVMEHECFEDAQVAEIMNKYFVCVKVDREERPDVDQIYMDAVHLMKQRGGWPLNCIALPDGKPFFGGTYFPKENWMELLEKIHNEYETNKPKVVDFAERLTEGIKMTSVVETQTDTTFNEAIVERLIEKWKPQFDPIDGGNNHAPKFPIPNNYKFLLSYSKLYKDKEVETHVLNTLDKIARGGIYDQLGGGFARYSVDGQWKVPHFEKMLYDNAQLTSLYAEAYKYTGSDEYLDVVTETIDFVNQEFLNPDDLFYSALDADSEGEEGKYYVWQKDELKDLLGDDFKLFSNYYNVNSTGFWEHGNYILLRDESNESFCKSNDLTDDELDKLKARWKKKLLVVRDQRIKPGLDDKSLTSWNALMISGYCHAYQATGTDAYLEQAIKSMKALISHQLKEKHLLHSYKAGRSTIDGFLEDYCFTIEALCDLYQSNGDAQYLAQAESLLETCIKEFYDESTGMFFFTNSASTLISRKTEISDNVIPASNSSMANALFSLGTLLAKDQYVEMSRRMLANVKESMPGYGAGYSNWALLHMKQTHAVYEVAITGSGSNTILKEAHMSYLPNTYFLWTEKESNLPLLINKFVKGSRLIYVCLNKSCQLPVNDWSEAIKQIKH